MWRNLPLRLFFQLFLACHLPPRFALAQARYDLLLKGGHVVDAKNHLSAVRDVAIANGKIAAVRENIPPAEARKTVDVFHLYVTPGLVDMHVHVFASSMGREYTGGKLRASRWLHVSQRRHHRGGCRKFRLA